MTNDNAASLREDSRACFSIDGAAAREVLVSAITLDLHPDVFRAGHCALTGWHHTPVLLDHVDTDRHELYAMRTFALWVWESLVDAARPLGYDVLEQLSN